MSSYSQKISELFWKFGSERRPPSDLVPVSRKTRKLIGPVKPFLMICFSKRKQCIGIKLCMEVNFVLIKTVKKKQKKQLCKL